MAVSMGICRVCMACCLRCLMVAADGYVPLTPQVQRVPRTAMHSSLFSCSLGTWSEPSGELPFTEGKGREAEIICTLWENTWDQTVELWCVTWVS